MVVNSESRIEDTLNIMLGKLDKSHRQEPQSRIEALLLELSEHIGQVGGNVQIHICTSDEYNHETLVPTIDNPETNSFYLVPSGESNDDIFVEWIYTENNQWERFGSSPNIGSGTTFTPFVSSAGIISWTNDGGKTNPASVDLVAAVIDALPSAVGVSF